MNSPQLCVCVCVWLISHGSETDRLLLYQGLAPEPGTRAWQHNLAAAVPQIPAHSHVSSIRGDITQSLAHSTICCRHQCGGGSGRTDWTRTDVQEPSCCCRILLHRQSTALHSCRMRDVFSGSWSPLLYGKRCHDIQRRVSSQSWKLCLEI